LKAIDLNADLGEGCPWDDLLIPLISSASIACGTHAGDPRTMRATLAATLRQGITAGAHPGYLDRENFGRVEQGGSIKSISHLILDQWSSLRLVAELIGVPIRFLKPHGALYNQAHRSEPHARGIVEAALTLGTPVLGMPGGLVEHHANRHGVRFVAEGFADRRYQSDGSLVPRSQPDSLLRDPAEVAEQVIALVGRGIETICIHGDQPGAVELALAIRETLDHAGIVVRSPF
jgi:UPF0271 protein